MIPSCESHPTAAEDPDATPVNSDLPGPERAQAAADRVKPLLEKRLNEANLHWGNPVFLRIFKEEKQLELWMQAKAGAPFKHFKTYPIHAFSGNLGPKLKEGDRQAPEGFYRVDKKAMNPASRFHLSFNLGYPNHYDQQHGRTGSYLMVHGNNVSAGCYAMGDLQIEEIYSLCDAAIQNGQNFFQVHCYPFRMNPDKLERSGEWKAFWTNLKEGYDLFESSKKPPLVETKNRSYIFTNNKTRALQRGERANESR